MVPPVSSRRPGGREIVPAALSTARRASACRAGGSRAPAAAPAPAPRPARRAACPRASPRSRGPPGRRAASGRRARACAPPPTGRRRPRRAGAATPGRSTGVGVQPGKLRVGPEAREPRVDRVEQLTGGADRVVVDAVGEQSHLAAHAGERDVVRHDARVVGGAGAGAGAGAGCGAAAGAPAVSTAAGAARSGRVGSGRRRRVVRHDDAAHDPPHEHALRRRSGARLLAFPDRRVGAGGDLPRERREHGDERDGRTAVRDGGRALRASRTPTARRPAPAGSSCADAASADQSSSPPPWPWPPPSSSPPWSSKPSSSPPGP